MASQAMLLTAAPAPNPAVQLVGTVPPAHLDPRPLHRVAPQRRTPLTSPSFYLAAALTGVAALTVQVSGLILAIGRRKV